MYLYTLHSWGAITIYYANIRNVRYEAAESAGFQLIREAVLIPVAGYKLPVTGSF